MKCKQKREMKNVQETAMANGKPAKRGQCGECGTNMFKIGKGPNVGVAGGKSKRSKRSKRTKAGGKSKRSKAGGKSKYSKRSKTGGKRSKRSKRA